MLFYRVSHLGVSMNDDLILQNQSASLPFTDFILTTGSFILGRSSRCDFIVMDVTISRRHAEITFVGGCVAVHDLDSRNGTYVDDERVRTSRVQQGQRLRFGSVSFLLGNISLDMDEPNSELE